MAEYSDAFGKRVNQILQDRQMSPWEVERQSKGDISHMTVRQMQRGALVGSDYIVTFAATAGRDERESSDLAVELLRLAGRGRLVEIIAKFTRVIQGAGGNAAAPFSPA